MRREGGEVGQREREKEGRVRMLREKGPAYVLAAVTGMLEHLEAQAKVIDYNGEFNVCMTFSCWFTLTRSGAAS